MPKQKPSGSNSEMNRNAKPLYSRRRFTETLLWSVPASLLGPQILLADTTPDNVPSSLGFVRDKVDFQARAQWTDIEPDVSLMNQATTYERITVHHTGTRVIEHTAAGDVAFDLECILGAHRKRQFGDIGYHFVVDRVGRVWEGRPLRYEGAHVSSENHGNVGVMLLGNFEHQRPSDQQIDVLHRVTAAIQSELNISSDRIYGHRDLGRTLCPGRYLYGYVEKLKDLA